MAEDHGQERACYTTLCNLSPVTYMRLARIVKSNSHLDYVGRIIDALDGVAAPDEAAYGFAQFVSMPLDAGGIEIIGVIYNSELANPEYGSYGPRLSPAPDLKILSPDYLNEQGVLIGILLLGWREGETIRQGVPRRIVPVNQDVYGLDDEGVHAFHRDARGDLHLDYYSQVLTHAGSLGVPLIEAVIAQLEQNCTAEEKLRLEVLRQALRWQRTMGGLRL